jgi:hypothetical protein
MDESNFTRYEQQGRGWGVAGSGARIYRPKGKSPTYNVMATIGAGGILHYVMHKPDREERPLAVRYEASELAAPGEALDVGYSASEIRQSLTVTELKDVLREHQVKLSDEAGRPLGLSQMRDTVLQLNHAGRLGLLRGGGPRFQGGPKKPHRGTADDAADCTIVWDNASSHGAQGTKTGDKVSVFERLATEWGFNGVV